MRLAAARPTRWSGAPTRSSRSTNNQMTFKSYYKMPAPQTPNENCVAHNGSLIPVPGRDIMVQGWYQGGISVFDFTDPRASEGDRVLRSRADGCDQAGRGGVVVGVLVQRATSTARRSRAASTFSSCTPSALLTQNEIDAAKLVHFDDLNAQDQPKLVWPASFVVARAYLDQLDAVERPAGRADQHDARRAGAGGARVRAGTPRCAEPGLDPAERRCGGIERPEQGPAVDRRGERSGQVSPAVD